MGRKRGTRIRVYHPERIIDNRGNVKYRIRARNPATGKMSSRTVVSETQAEATYREFCQISQDVGTRTVGQSIDDFMRDLPHLRDVTKKSMLVQFKRFFPQEIPVNLITTKLMQEYCDNIFSKNSYAVYKKGIQQVRRLTTWLVTEGYISVDPMGKIKVKKGKMHTGKKQLSKSEADRLLAFIRERAKTADRAGRDAMVCICAYCFGMRVSDIVNLTCRALDNDRLYYVAQKTGKPSAWDVGPYRELFAIWCTGKKPDERMLGMHSIHQARFGVIRTCQRAGVTRVCAHALRGGYATEKTRLGVPVQSIAEDLGHSSPQTTLRHYVRADLPTETPRGAEKLEPTKKIFLDSKYFAMN